MAIGASIVRLVAGNSAAQAIQLAAMPLLTRFFEPDSFGVYTLFVGACVVLSVFAGLKYDGAIQLPARDGDAAALATLVVLLATISAVLVAIATAVVALFWHERETALVFGGGVVATLLTGAAMRVGVAWLGRLNRFGRAGIAQVVVVLATVMGQVLLVRAGHDELTALVAGHVAGQFLGVLSCGPLEGLWRALARIAARRRRRLRCVARRYERFPKFLIPYGLSSTLRDRLVHLSLSGLAGAATLGHFAMASRLASAPNSLLYGGIAPVLYAHAARAPREAIARYAGALIEVSGLTLAPLFVLIALESEAVAASFLGPDWADAAPYIALLALPYFTLSTTSWLDRLFDAYNTQNFALRLDVGFTFTLVAAVSFAAWVSGGEGAATVFAVTFTAYEIGWTLIAYRAHGLPVGALRRPTLGILASLVASGMVLELLRNSLGPKAMLLVFSLAYAGYVAIVFMAGPGRESLRVLFAPSR